MPVRCEGAVQDGQRLDVEHLDVDGGLLEQLHPLVHEEARHAHREDLVGALVLGRAQDLGVQDGLVGRMKAEIAVLHLEGGDDPRGRQRRQRHLANHNLGASDGSHDGLAVGAGVRHRQVDRLADLLHLRLGRHRRGPEARDDEVASSAFQRQGLDRAGADVEAHDPPAAKETLEHRPLVHLGRSAPQGGGRPVHLTSSGRRYQTITTGRPKSPEKTYGYWYWQVPVGVVGKVSPGPRRHSIQNRGTMLTSHRFPESPEEAGNSAGILRGSGKLAWKKRGLPPDADTPPQPLVLKELLKHICWARNDPTRFDKYWVLIAPSLYTYPMKRFTRFVDDALAMFTFATGVPIDQDQEIVLGEALQRPRWCIAARA